jgi:hypothetical protein
MSLLWHSLCAILPAFQRGHVVRHGSVHFDLKGSTAVLVLVSGCVVHELAGGPSLPS